MDIIVIGILSVIATLLGVYSLFNWNKKDSYGDMRTDVAISSIFCGVVFVAVLVSFALSWNGAYALPYEYIKYEETIEETQELLMRYENLSGDIGNIGNGLESMEMKQKISEMIEQKYRLKLDIKAYLNNPFTLWKDVVRDRCYELGIEI